MAGHLSTQMAPSALRRRDLTRMNDRNLVNQNKAGRIRDCHKPCIVGMQVIATVKGWKKARGMIGVVRCSILIKLIATSESEGTA